MANKEDYLDALTAYSKNPSQDIPAILEQYLNGVAKNGETLFHWQLLKPLIMGKMDQVIGELRQRLSSEHIPDRPNVENVSFDTMQERIMDALSKFNGAPFTIQRLCELLIDPKRHYRRSDKFLRGLEKNVSVVSTVDPYGRKVVSESGIKHLVNGIDTNGSPFYPRDSNITSNLPPVPGWVTTSSSSRPKHTQKVTDSSKQKPSEQTSPTSPLPTSDADNALSSLEADQKEAVVHSDVVEETVVTMDTSETGTIATDGGEAMAEMDDSEEEMQGVDSSAPSSSSFPEELSVSNTGESSAAQVETNSSVTSTQARVETSDTSEAESAMDTSSSDCNQLSTDSSSSSHNLPTSPDKQTELTSSSEASPSPVEYCEQNDLIDTSAESGSESASCSSHEQESSGDSCSSSAPALGENAASPSGIQCHGSDVGDSCSTTASDVESDRSRIDIDDIPSSTAPSSSDEHLNHEPSLSNTTEVTASSTTDILPSVTPLVCAETHDSVAGLERLVDSVDTSVLPAPFSSVSTLPPLTCRHENSESSSLSSSVDTTLDCEEPETKHRRLSDEEPSSKLDCEEPEAKHRRLSDEEPSSKLDCEEPEVKHRRLSDEEASSSFDTSLDCEEPEAKRCRLSDEGSSSSFSTLSSAQVSASSETEASSTNCTSDTPVKSNIQADSSDSTVGTLQTTSEDLKTEQESPSAALCSANDMDVSSVVSSENGTSSHQLSSPDDSQGFDVIENTVNNNSAEEK